MKALGQRQQIQQFKEALSQLLRSESSKAFADGVNQLCHQYAGYDADDQPKFTLPDAQTDLWSGKLNYMTSYTINQFVQHVQQWTQEVPVLKVIPAPQLAL